MHDKAVFLVRVKPLRRNEIFRLGMGNFPGGPVVKNPASNAGDVGSIHGLGTKIPHAAGQLSPCNTSGKPSTATAEPVYPSPRSAIRRTCMLQLRPSTAKKKKDLEWGYLMDPGRAENLKSPVFSRLSCWRKQATLHLRRQAFSSLKTVIILLKEVALQEDA